MSSPHRPDDFRPSLVLCSRTARCVRRTPCMLTECDYGPYCSRVCVSVVAETSTTGCAHKKWTNKVHRYLMLSWQRKVAKHSITSYESDIVLLINRLSHTRKWIFLSVSCYPICSFWENENDLSSLQNAQSEIVCWQIKRKKKEETMDSITCLEHLAVN